jgi:hypothetical protein
MGRNGCFYLWWRGRHMITIEQIEDINFDLRKWVLDEIIEVVKEVFEEPNKVFDYDFLYGEGAYEKFIFGGGAGL